MPYCSECGKDFQNTAKFCPHCGSPNTLSGNNNSSTNNTELDHVHHKTDAPEFQTVKRAGGSSYGAYRLEDLPEGFIIDERYEVKKKLGQGGFGAVYLVFDKQMDIEKALKIIPESIASDKEAMSDLQTEARTMVSLNHENIVRVYDFHNNGPIKYIDMEYVSGKSLNEVKLDYKEKKLPEDLVKSLAVKIALGLGHAHRNNIIHKDIKPQNIMLTEDGLIKIMDFGISETVRTSMSRVANSSSSGTLVYMSPEQVKGKEIGKASDIYSFGALLYELLSSHPPFYKGSIEYQIFNERPEDLEGVSPALNSIIQKCLEKNYKDRYQSFEVLVATIINSDMQKNTEDDFKEHKKELVSNHEKKSKTIEFSEKDASKLNLIPEEKGLKKASWLVSLIIATAMFYPILIGFISIIDSVLFCILIFIGVFVFFRIIILIRISLLLKYKKAALIFVFIISLFCSFLFGFTYSVINNNNYDISNSYLIFVIYQILIIGFTTIKVTIWVIKKYLIIT